MMKMSLGELRGVYLYLRVRAHASHRYAMQETLFTAVKVAGETRDHTACDRWRPIVDEMLAGVPRPIRDGIHRYSASAEEYAERIAEEKRRGDLFSDSCSDMSERIRAARESLENAECVGLDDNNGTCQTQPGWRDNVDKWCHVCTALFHLGARPPLRHKPDEEEDHDES